MAAGERALIPRDRDRPGRPDRRATRSARCRQHPLAERATLATGRGAAASCVECPPRSEQPPPVAYTPQNRAIDMRRRSDPTRRLRRHAPDAVYRTIEELSVLFQRHRLVRRQLASARERLLKPHRAATGFRVVGDARLSVPPRAARRSGRRPAPPPTPRATRRPPDPPRCLRNAGCRHLLHPRRRLRSPPPPEPYEPNRRTLPARREPALRVSLLLGFGHEEALSMAWHTADAALPAINYPDRHESGWRSERKRLCTPRPMASSWSTLSAIDLGQGMKSVTRQIAAEDAGRADRRCLCRHRRQRYRPALIWAALPRAVRTGSAMRSFAAASEARHQMLEAAAEELEVSAGRSRDGRRGQYPGQGRTVAARSPSADTAIAFRHSSNRVKHAFRVGASS